MTSAPGLASDDSYSGTLAAARAQAWYRLEAGNGEKVAFEVRGRTPSCPVRASLVDGAGDTLAELISSARESLPFLASVPPGASAQSYYLRIDTPPGLACAGAGYTFRLLYPQEDPCEAPAPKPGEQRQIAVCPSSESYGPDEFKLETAACDRISAVVNGYTHVIGRERGEVEHGRGSRGRLARRERAEHTLKLRARHICGSA